MTMSKTSAVAVALATAPGIPTVFTTGFISRIGAAAEQRNHFYMTGSMGLALSLGTGIALSSRQATLVVDGDGSLLMNPVGLIMAGGGGGPPPGPLILCGGG